VFFLKREHKRILHKKISQIKKTVPVYLKTKTKQQQAKNVLFYDCCPSVSTTTTPYHW
jgi:hypothetical protein